MAITDDDPLKFLLILFGLILLIWFFAELIARKTTWRNEVHAQPQLQTMVDGMKELWDAEIEARVKKLDLDFLSKSHDSDFKNGEVYVSNINREELFRACERRSSAREGGMW